MKPILSFLILIVLLASCGSSGSEHKFTLPSNSEINDVIAAVIEQDSMPVVKNAHKRPAIIQGDETTSKEVFVCIPICPDLQKAYITTASKHSKYVDNPGVDIEIQCAVALNKLITREADGFAFFNKSDSAFLLFQNDTLTAFTIDTLLSKKLCTTTVAREQTTGNRSYYDLSIPIFSQDLRKAYVVQTYNCEALCGGATGIYLQKINSKWKIVHRKTIWIS